MNEKSCFAQIFEMFCLIASLPLVFINLEMHLQSYYPKYSSKAVLINYRYTPTYPKYSSKAVLINYRYTPTYHNIVVKQY